MNIFIFIFPRLKMSRSFSPQNHQFLTRTRRRSFLVGYLIMEPGFWRYGSSKSDQEKLYFTIILPYNFLWFFGTHLSLVIFFMWTIAKACVLGDDIDISLFACSDFDTWVNLLLDLWSSFLLGLGWFFCHAAFFGWDGMRCFLAYIANHVAVNSIHPMNIFKKRFFSLALSSRFVSATATLLLKRSFPIVSSMRWSFFCC